MPMLPFRGLAERGILRDPAPYQLDLNAWSKGSNMRFHSNRAMRSPVWRQVGSVAPIKPQHVIGYRPSTGYDQVFLIDPTGRQYLYTTGLFSDVSPVGFGAGTSTTAAFTSTFLGDVQYINRPSAVPYYWAPASTLWATLPNWDATWRCRSLRAFGDYLIALNVTKGTNTQKTLVKWSDLTLIGQVPGSWDATDPTKNTGENPLEDMQSPIVDGWPMRSSFIIYSTDQIWAMTPVPTNDVFTFRRLFSEGGLIAPNCVTEVDGKHYVFGPEDIYVHDGTTKTSIIDQRNRDYVYRNLDMRRSEVCWVYYSPALNEVLFAYPCGDADTPYSGTDRPNKAAVYNIPGNTWSFVDLPNIAGMTTANLNHSMSYADAAIRPAPVTFANIGGSFYDQDSGYGNHMIGAAAAGGQFIYNRLVAYDFMNKGKLAYPYIAELNAAAYLERTGLDLDQLGGDLITYKNIRRVFPQVTMFDNIPVQVQLGGALTPSGDVTWGPQISFDPTKQYKVDWQKGGRYLAIRYTVNTPCDFEVQGFDVEVTPGGRR